LKIKGFNNETGEEKEKNSDDNITGTVKKISTR